MVASQSSGTQVAHAGTQHYATLDAMRGAAALSVAAMHASKLGNLQLMPSGYLAVDLFFMLSGFVIANAYDARLAAGLGARRFMLQRFIRLYPLYLLGTAVGVAVVAAGLDASWSGAGLARATGYAAAMLPVPPWPAGVDDHSTLYPLNDAAWSLLFELLVNLLFVLVHRRLGLRLLVIWVGLAALGLAATVVDAGSLERGWSWDGFAVGAARVGFSFPLGVLLCRLQAADQLPRWRMPSWGVVAAMLALLTLPSPGYAGEMWRDLGIVMLVMPVLLIAGIHSETAVPGVADWLGTVSYPLYMLHGPVLALLVGLALRHGYAADAIPLWYRQAGMLMVVLACVPVARLFDTPARRWLSGLVARSRPALR
jgi:peptidoglycan/LPS O-acetylase OafA/YrhL